MLLISPSLSSQRSVRCSQTTTPEPQMFSGKSKREAKLKATKTQDADTVDFSTSKTVVESESPDSPEATQSDISKNAASSTEAPASKSAEKKAEPAPSKETEEEDTWDRISNSETAEPEESLEKPSTEDYAAHLVQEQRNRDEEIGRMFRLPGQMILGVDNQARALSRRMFAQTRKTMEQAQDMATTARNTVCQTTAESLRSMARTIENWQDLSNSSR